MNYCKICGKEIHPKRVQLGYKRYCTEHSDVYKYTGLVVAENDADYRIDIIRDEETAKDIERLMKYKGQPDT